MDSEQSEIMSTHSNSDIGTNSAAPEIDAERPFSRASSHIEGDDDDYANQSKISTIPADQSVDSASSDTNETNEVELMFTDSDSEDDENALTKSLTRIKISKSPTYSFSSSYGLSTILSENISTKRFPILELNELMNQKAKMIDLNKILEAYMKDNKNKDKNIQELCDQLKETGQDKQEDMKKVPGMVRDLTERKVDAETSNDKLIKYNSDIKILDMKNTKFEKECQRTENEIKRLQAQIAEMNDLISEVDEELEKDKSEIEEKEPEKNTLADQFSNNLREHRSKIQELIRVRKGGFTDPQTEFEAHKPKNDLHKLLEQYRIECVREKGNFVPEDLAEMRVNAENLENAVKSISEQITSTDNARNELINNFYEIDCDIRIMTQQLENLGDQIEGERLRFKFNLDAPDNIKELEALNALLKQRYKEAQEYFIKVQLQEIGQKERIDNELKEMAGHLDLAEE